MYAEYSTIITDEKLLRVKCEPVLPNEIGPLKEHLENVLANSKVKGIGLAAPQVGIAKQMAIVRIPDGPSVELVNCRIAEGFDKQLIDYEGCLSFPGRFEKTFRFQEIRVVDNLAEPNSFIATGLFAVAIQHEHDHLHSVLLPDVALPRTHGMPKNGKVKLRPNDPCSCGSGKKFKKCCGTR